MTRLATSAPDRHMVTRWSKAKQGEPKRMIPLGCLVQNEGESGALGGIRTPDTWFRRPVLYPLSYERLKPVFRA